jgi:phosphohistidine phosphatase
MAGLRLYFLRHGKALPRSDWHEDDDLRPLTPGGEKEVERVGATLAAMGVRPDLIVSSPLARAWRTAELVAGVLGAVAGPIADDRLGHGFDRPALAGIIADHRPKSSIVLVGHEPSFSAVIGELIGGGYVVCKKAGVARVYVDGADLGGGQLVWLLPPLLLARE